MRNPFPHKETKEGDTMKISDMIETINTYVAEGQSLKVFLLSIEDGITVYRRMKANNCRESVFLDSYSSEFNRFQTLDTAEELVERLRFCMEDNGDRKVYNITTVKPIQSISLKETENGKALVIY